MYSNNKVAKAVRLAMLFSAASATAITSNAFAQDEDVERIEVTGSSIKRTDMEGALPVQIITAEDIARTGVTNTADLIAQLPSMQGFTTPSDSVGGSGGGIRTANLRDLGDQYTLVLVNGRRIATADDSSTVDISAIPFGAIKRVEVLTDGASALYGSDAIAGVVNFILKEEVEETTVSVRYDKPQESGGEKFTANITTGFGDYDRDGFSFVVSYSHESQEQLASAERDFAKTGIIEFDHPDYDSQLRFFNGSANAIPANARIQYNQRDENGDWIYLRNEDDSFLLDENGDRIRQTFTDDFNPYARQNGGACFAQNTPDGDWCSFDYTSTIEIIPETDKDSAYAHLNFKISEDIRGFATATYAKSSMTARIAPYPTGLFNLPIDSAIVQTEVLANTTIDFSETQNVNGTEVATREITGVQGLWRALPLENRTTEYESTSYNIVLGLEGSYDDIDFSGGLTYSVYDQDIDYPTGWLKEAEYVTAIESGQANVFKPITTFEASEIAVFNDALYSGDWEDIKNTTWAFDAKASKPIFELAGGDAYLAVGVDYRNTVYDRDVDPANTNEVVLREGGEFSYEMERANYGAFTELLMPVTDTLEITGSLRYDNIGAVKNNFTGQDANDSESDVTYKVSFNWSATDDLKLRASYGTGFKAPSMREIAEPRVAFGVTSGSYACPDFVAGDIAKTWCTNPTGEIQFNVFNEGNANIKPETSEQYSVGFVFSPSTDFSVTVDYWNIQMEDQVDRPTEQQIIAGAPDTYRDLITFRTNTVTGEPELAIIREAQNLNSAEKAGFDYNIRKINEFSFGSLTTELSGTYFMKSEDSLSGSSLGRFGANNEVTFRNLLQLSSTLEHGDFAHNVQLNFRSGYHDSAQNVEVVDTGETFQLQLEVPSYTLINYQTKYSGLVEGLDLTFGVNNLFDREPPLSLRKAGAGHQVGWDPRYADAYGRTFYLQADYSF